MNRLSVRIRVFVGVVAATALLGTVALVLVDRELRNAYADAGRGQALSITRTLNSHFKHWDLEHGQHLKRDLSTLQRLEPKLLRISVYSTEDGEVRRVTSTAPGGEVDAADAAPIRTGRTVYRVKDGPGGRVAEVNAPLVGRDGRPYGSIGVYLDLRDIDARLDTRRRALAAGLGLLGLALALAITATLGGAVLRPLRRLRHAHDALRGGDLRTRLRWNRRDEIGVLAEGFDAMASELEERTRQVRRVASESQSRFQTGFEHAPVGMALADRGGRFVAVNPAFCRMLGRSADELCGLSFRDITHPEDVSDSAEPMVRALRGEVDSWQVDKRFVSSSGETVWAHVNVALLRDEAGTPLCFYGHIEDTTQRRRAELERKELEGRLAQSERLEAVGRLAGGVAHDFNNLLAVISNYASFAAEEAPAGSTLADDVQEIRRAAERAAALTHQLLVFSRREVIRPRMLDLNEVVRDTERLLERTLGEDIELEVCTAPVPALVHADVGQLEQVLVNLAVNARDAMPAGGSLRIAVDAVAPPPPDAGAQGLDPLAGWVALEVEDSGEGMPAEIAARAFEPFFTTKPKGDGTGLGLATVYGIATQAGGAVVLDSEPGCGTTVRIVLPFCEDEIAEPAEVPAVRPSVPRARTVLVAEDEPAVRRLIRRILEGEGYEVLDAADAAEALEVAGEHDGPIHALLTDVVMPGPSGKTLAERLTAERPETLVVYMSGYTDDVVVRHGIRERHVAFLQKPFDPQTLLDTVAAALTESSYLEPA